MQSSFHGVGVVFDLDVVKNGYHAMDLFMERTNPSLLAYCLIASGDFRRPESEVVKSYYDYCIAVYGPESSIEYILRLFNKSDIPGLAPKHRRIIQQPILDQLGLTEDGFVDSHGRLVTDVWYRVEHDQCKESGWGYAPRTVNCELSAELSAELEELRSGVVKADSKQSDMEASRYQRDICGRCEITHEERLQQWNAPAPPGVVKFGSERGAFMYCENCKTGICGKCSIDLGMSAGCPLCETELIYMDGEKQ